MKAKYVLHEFTMGDVDDLEIYVAEPLYQWQQTEAGKWCMEKAEDIYWTSSPNPHVYGHKIQVIGTLSDKYATYYALKRT